MTIGFRDGVGDIDETELCLVEELVKSGLKDCTDGRVIQVRTKHSAQSLGFVAEVPCFAARNAVESVAELIGAKTDGAWKLSMKDEELGHLPARDLSDIRLEVGF